jgi:Tol biopolymer transport system component
MPNWGDFRVRISPQGTHLAYPGSDENRTTIILRPLDSLGSITLVSPSADPWDLTFSPDGERLAFFTNRRRLQTVSIRGGQPEELFEFPAHQAESGLSWGSDESILIGGEGGLTRVPTSGAASEFISAAEKTDIYAAPFFLPDGDHALVSIVRPGEAPRLAVINLETAAAAELPFQGSEPIYSPTGHILFRQGAELLAVGFDLDSMQVSGQAREIATRVAYGPRLSEDGTLVYVTERVDGTASLVWVDRQGVVSPVGGERGDYTHIDLSPDGTRALLNSGEEIYAYDINRGSFSLVTSDTSAGSALFPLWDPNGELATFRQGPAVYKKMADGSGQQDTLLEFSAVPTSWSPDGENLAFFDSQSDIWILPREGEPQPFLDGPTNERSGRFSPDGSAFAYVSDELDGEFQVYVTPFPGPGPRIAVSIEGGLSPLWSEEGDELYFRQGSKVMAASVTLTPEIDVSIPHELFDGPYTLDLSGHQRYDVAPDGRFLMVENSEDFRVVVVEGFFEELNRLVPTE